MPLLRPLDPAFPIAQQLAVDAAPVVLVNVFTLDAADEQTFLDVWQDDAAFMKRQPGFIATQLHRAIGASATYLKLCGLGIDRALPGGVLASGVRGEALGLSGVGRGRSAPVPEGRGAGHLRRLIRPSACVMPRRVTPRRSSPPTRRMPA